MIDKNELLDLISLNTAAYVIEHGTAVALPPGFTPAIPFSIGSARPCVLAHDPLLCWGFVTTRRNTKYVVFRGTQNGWEWIQDGLALPTVPFSSGRAHRGFAEAWDALKHPVLAACGGVWALDTVITGHSLGAALATCCRAEFGGRLVTFAGPRVGDPAFGTCLNDITRVVNEPDVVPHLPPVIFGFKHAGKEIVVHGPSDGINFHVAHSLKSYTEGVNKL